MNEVFPWQEAPEADFAVIGSPVDHSLSPQMHRAAYAALGLPYRYEAWHVPTGEVCQALSRLERLGYRGVNATVPHKEEVLGWPIRVDPFAARVRAANTIDLKRSACINTDAPGFLETLEDIDVSPGIALVLGAGGSARALATALVDAGWTVRIYNRTPAKAEQLAVEAGAEAVTSPDPSEADLILNTTSASLQGEEIGIDWDAAAPGAVAYDLMYAKESTPFLRAASAHGLQTVDGLRLLAAQGALSLEWWLGIKAPRKVMLDAIR